MKRHYHSRHHEPKRHVPKCPPGVPPGDLIREDFQRLSANVRLRTSRLVEELILMQSIEGHAHEGHGAFAGKRYINTTMQDAVLALGKDPRVVTAQRQELIDEIFDWVQRAARGESGNLLTTATGHPLLDIGLFRQIEVNPIEVLRGIYLGGLRDDSMVRTGVEERFGIKIGGGETALVDVQVMEDLGLDAEKLAHGEWQDKIEEFRTQGMIVQYTGDESRRVRFLYIRHRRGGGTSDDAAIVAAGKMFGPSAALGAFLADAVDTLEKYVPLESYSDQDDDMSRWIEKNVPNLGVTSDDVHKMTYLCAVPEEAKELVPDSSLRWMMAIDPKVDQTAFESHLAYLQGRPYSPMLLAFERILNQDFYDWFEDHLQSFSGNA